MNSPALTPSDAFQDFRLLPALPAYAGLCPVCANAFSYEQHGLVTVDGSPVASDKCYTCKTVRPHVSPASNGVKSDPAIYREDFAAGCYRRIA